jgi:hypothetical protein
LPQVGSQVVVVAISVASGFLQYEEGELALAGQAEACPTVTGKANILVFFEISFILGR